MERYEHIAVLSDGTRLTQDQYDEIISTGKLDTEDGRRLQLISWDMPAFAEVPDLWLRGEA